MAPATTNWLSFSLSSMEMMRSSESQFDISYNDSSSTASPHYLIDNFYVNGFANSKGTQATATTMATDASIYTTLMEPITTCHSQQPPKLEDFLGDSASMVRYHHHHPDSSQTETQDSSLTHIYDHHNSAAAAAFFHDQQDLKAITGFQVFPANSGSEVDDSGSVVRSRLNGNEFLGHSIESNRSELGFSYGGSASNGLSLGVNSNSSKVNNNNNNSNNINIQVNSDNKSIVVAESDGSKKIADTFGQRTSIYRGVTRHRWTGRYEAHLWDNSCRREGQARKGRQVYLGGYDKEDKAARAYDLAALKYWGPTATTNFPVSNYTKELEEMKYVSKQEFIASLRRKSSGFSRGASIYRGVTRHHQQGRWQARIGRVAGNKDLYLGTFATEEEAAEAYDIAAIKFRGMNAVTNFEMNRYDVEAIMKSALPVGGASKRLKLSPDIEEKPVLTHYSGQALSSCTSGSNNSISFTGMQSIPTIPCGIPYDTAASLYPPHNIYHHFQPATNYFPPSSSTVSSALATPSPSSVASQTAEFFLWPHQSY